MSIATKTEERNGANQDQEGRDIFPSAKINLSPSAKNNPLMSTSDHPAGVSVSAPTAENEAVENNDSNLIHKLIHKMVSPVTIRRVFDLLSFSFRTHMFDALMFDFLFTLLKHEGDHSHPEDHVASQLASHCTAFLSLKPNSMAR